MNKGMNLAKKKKPFCKGFFFIQLFSEIILLFHLLGWLAVL